MTVTTSGTKLDDLSVNSPSIAVQRGMNRVGKILLVFYALEKTLANFAPEFTTPF